MAYADYTFYKEKYYGTAIAEEDFNRLADRASDKLDAMTFDRLVSGLPANSRSATKVKKAVCAVAEKIQEIEAAEKMAQAGGMSLMNPVILSGTSLQASPRGVSQFRSVPHLP